MTAKCSSDSTKLYWRISFVASCLAMYKNNTKVMAKSISTPHMDSATVREGVDKPSEGNTTNQVQPTL